MLFCGSNVRFWHKADIPDFRPHHFQSAGVTRYDALSWPEEGNEAARVHHNSRRCRGVAACGARAATADDACDWISQWGIRGTVPTAPRWISQSTERDRLFRRPERDVRIPLRRRSI